MTSRVLDPSRTVRIGARLGYVAIILMATLWHLQASYDHDLVVARLWRAFHPRILQSDAIDFARNVLLFMGLGAVWVLTAPSGGMWRRILRATVAGTVLSASVETLQLLSPYRNASTLDLFSNGLGAFAGAFVLASAVAATAAMRGKRSYLGFPALVFAGAYTTAMAFEAFAPHFRRVLPGNVWGTPMRRLAITLSQRPAFDLALVPKLDTLLGVPAALFVVAALLELGLSYSVAASAAALLGFAIAFGGEIAHGMLGQAIHSTAIVAHAVGPAIGALAAYLWLPTFSRRFRGSQRALVLFALYGATLALWAWRPFQFELSRARLSAQLHYDHFIPLAALIDSFDFFGVADVAIDFALFAPVGALLAVWPMRRRGLLHGALPAIYLSCALEMGQLLLRDRFFDVTDVMVQASGAALGFLIMRRSGFRPLGEMLAGGDASRASDHDAPARSRSSEPRAAAQTIESGQR